MEGGTIGWGFQVMLMLIIYLISGWRWALFTSVGDTGNWGEKVDDEWKRVCIKRQKIKIKVVLEGGVVRLRCCLVFEPVMSSTVVDPDGSAGCLSCFHLSPAFKGYVHCTTGLQFICDSSSHCPEVGWFYSDYLIFSVQYVSDRWNWV